MKLATQLIIISLALACLKLQFAFKIETKVLVLIECAPVPQPLPVALSNEIANLAYDLSEIGGYQLQTTLFRSQDCLDTNLQANLSNEDLDETTPQTLHKPFSELIFRQNY
jgi:hypothetical protein